MRKGSPTREEDVRDLAAQHPPVSDALAGESLGKPVELSDPDWRECEQVPVATTVQYKGVPVSGSRLRDHGHRVANWPVPRKRGTRSHWGHRGDHRKVHCERLAGPWPIEGAEVPEDARVPSV